ncbi:MAG: signal peptidase I [bacterium]|nr:signal peptidase I [bacterium]
MLVARLLIATRPAEEQRAALMRGVREWLDTVIVVGGLILVLTSFVARPFYIPSGSMEPTLQIDDVLLVDELDYHLRAPRRGEIAVFHPPADLSQDWIKRVIAVPGDTLEIRNGAVYVDGRALREPYLAAAPEYDLAVRNCTITVDGQPLSQPAVIPPRPAWQACDRIPDGYYFMMGDNRNNSDDSHIWGLLPRSAFVGRTLLRIWPPQRLAFFKS